MTGDPGVDALIRQWAAEREQTVEEQEVNRIASAHSSRMSSSPELAVYPSLKMR